MNKTLGGYLMPYGYGEAEYVEKKSRFIGRVWPAESEEQALEFLRQTREKHRDASHNVYAYIIRENNISRYSDAGEPSGTAGTPALNVFLSEGVTNVCCVITRYFGGTLLGAGGLVRAYSKTAKLALDAAGIARMDSYAEIMISVEYSFYERARLILEEFEAVIEATDFGTDVVIEALARRDKTDALREALTEASNGRAVFEPGAERFLGLRIR
jgi:uncharacterized YigZ family protein